MAAKIAMMAMTTKSSISVKPKTARRREYSRDATSDVDMEISC